MGYPCEKLRGELAENRPSRAVIREFAARDKGKVRICQKKEEAAWQEAGLRQLVFWAGCDKNKVTEQFNKDFRLSDDLRERRNATGRMNTASTVIYEYPMYV